MRIRDNLWSFGIITCCDPCSDEGSQVNSFDEK